MYAVISCRLREWLIYQAHSSGFQLNVICEDTLLLGCLASSSFLVEGENVFFFVSYIIFLTPHLHEGKENVLLKALLLKVQLAEQQHQHHLGPC